MKSFGFFNGLTLILVIIGAINWGLVAFFDWNLVEVIFGHASTAAKVVYAIIAFCGIWRLYLFI